MSKKFLTPIDLNKNELQNARIQNLATAPSSPVNGQIYYDTVSNTTYIYENGVWVSTNAAKAPNTTIPLAKLATDPLARANHTGTQTASTISDLATTVKAYRLDEFAAPTATVSLGGQVLSNVGTPVGANDAVNKAYADAASAGIDAKASVRAASTANLTLSGTQTVDGVSLIANDRVLVKDQTTQSANGIYLVAAGAWTRAADCNSSTNYTPQAFTFVEEGTNNAGSQWKVSSTGTFTIGTSNIVWAQFGASTAYVAGGGLTLTGNTFDVGAGTGITVGTDTISVDTTVVARKYSTTFGDGSSLVFVITHNLGTQDVHVAVRETASNAYVECDIVSTSTTTCTLSFAAAVASNALRVTVIG